MHELTENVSLPIDLPNNATITDATAVGTSSSSECMCMHTEGTMDCDDTHEQADWKTIDKKSRKKKNDR